MKQLLLVILLTCMQRVPLCAQVIAAKSGDITSNVLTEDVATVNGLNNYAEKVQCSDPGAAIKAIQSAISISRKLNYPLGLSIAYGLRAGLYFYEMKLDTCVTLLDEAYMLVRDKNEPAYKNQAANLINKYAAIEQRKQN